eukprot:scaffold81341_cov34-Prasinocladus_malaysianus.AAC.1
MRSAARVRVLYEYCTPGLALYDVGWYPYSYPYCSSFPQQVGSWYDSVRYSYPNSLRVRVRVAMLEPIGADVVNSLETCD